MSRVAIASVIGKAIGVADKLVDLEIRHLKTEIIGRDVFDQMGLVEDHGAVIRNDLAELVAADVEVGEKQVMVDDNDVGIFGPARIRVIKQDSKFGTFLADAGVRFCVDAAPERKIFGQIDKFAAVAGRGFPAPVADLVEIAFLLKPINIGWSSAFWMR